MSRKYHWWTLPQIRFVAELWRQNLSQDQIADRVMSRFGVLVTKNSINRLARTHRDIMPMKTREQILAAQIDGRKRAAIIQGGAPMTATRPYTYAEVLRISEAWRRNVAVPVIACDFNRTIGSIHYLVCRYRDLFPQRGASPRGKLFDREQARMMRHRGMTYRAIGESLGVSRMAIWHALRSAA